MFAESWSYQPFGVTILLLFAVTAGLSILPGDAKRRVLAAEFRHCLATNVLYIVFVTAFVTFGVLRSVLHLINPAS